MFESIQAILTRIPKPLCFSNNSMASRHLKTTMLLNFSEQLECPQFQSFDFWGAKMFSEFVSPSFPLGSACGAWAMGPRLPEAAHRCPSQSTSATSWSSSGFSRPRQPWKRRTNTAAASDEDLGRENPLEAMGFLCEEVDGMLMVQVFWDASLFCGKSFCQSFWHWYFVLFFVFLTILFRHLQLDSLWIDYFCVEIESACPSQSKLFWVSGASILMWTCNQYMLWSSVLITGRYIF